MNKCVLIVYTFCILDNLAHTLGGVIPRASGTAIKECLLYKPQIEF